MIDNATLNSAKDFDVNQLKDTINSAGTHIQLKRFGLFFKRGSSITLSNEQLTPAIKRNIVYTLAAYIPSYLDDLEHPYEVFLQVKTAPAKQVEKDVEQLSLPFQSDKQLRTEIQACFKGSDNASRAELEQRISKKLDAVGDGDALKVYLYRLCLTLSQVDPSEDFKGISNALADLKQRCWAWDAYKGQAKFEIEHEEEIESALKWGKLFLMKEVATSTESSTPTQDSHTFLTH